MYNFNHVYINILRETCSNDLIRAMKSIIVLTAAFEYPTARWDAQDIPATADSPGPRSRQSHRQRCWSVAEEDSAHLRHSVSTAKKSSSKYPTSSGHCKNSINRSAQNAILCNCI